jgi:hypothetical protein
MNLAFFTDAKEVYEIKFSISSVNNENANLMVIQETTQIVPCHRLQAAANIALGLLSLSYACRSSTLSKGAAVIVTGIAFKMIWSGIKGTVPTLSYSQQITAIRRLAIL